MTRLPVVALYSRPMSTDRGTPRLRGRRLLAQRERVRAMRPLCPHCEAEGVVRVGVELDHIVPLHTARGDDIKMAELLEDDNTQMLCIPHHRAKTARDMGYVPRPSFDVSGEPVGVDHHWARRQSGYGGGS